MRWILGGLKAMLLSYHFLTVTLILSLWDMGYVMWLISIKPWRRCIEFWNRVQRCPSLTSTKAPTHLMLQFRYCDKTNSWMVLFDIQIKTPFHTRFLELFGNCWAKHGSLVCLGGWFCCVAFLVEFCGQKPSYVTNKYRKHITPSFVFGN